LPVLDDRGMAPVNAIRRREMPGILDDCFGCPAVIVTGRPPVGEWHVRANGLTVADAILVHVSYRIGLSGLSMRTAGAAGRKAS